MTSYLDKYIDDLYMLRINFDKISKLENVGRSKVGNDFRKKGLESPWVWYQKIDTGSKSLDKILRQKYNSIVTRCNGNNNNKYHSKSYKGLDYMPIYEWVRYCNDNKEILISMWKDYENSGGEYKKSISIDRVDDEKGYTVDNLMFTTHGFNCWKRNVRPIKVIHKDKTNYFMSGEEASEFYGIRRQTIGDILRGQKRILSDEYEVSHSDTNTVLNEKGYKTLIEYYESVA